MIRAELFHSEASGLRNAPLNGIAELGRNFALSRVGLCLSFANECLQLHEDQLSPLNTDQRRLLKTEFALHMAVAMRTSVLEKETRLNNRVKRIPLIGPVNTANLEITRLGYDGAVAHLMHAVEIQSEGLNGSKDIISGLGFDLAQLYAQVETGTRKNTEIEGEIKKRIARFREELSQESLSPR